MTSQFWKEIFTLTSEFTFITRDGAPRYNDGRSNIVKSAGAKWLTCICSSYLKTSGELNIQFRFTKIRITTQRIYTFGDNKETLPDMENIPALLIRTWRGACRASQAAANVFTDDNDSRFSSITFKICHIRHPPSQCYSTSYMVIIKRNFAKTPDTIYSIAWHTPSPSGPTPIISPSFGFDTYTGSTLLPKESFNF